MLLELISYQVRDREFTLWLEKTIAENQIEIIAISDIPFVYTDGKNAEIAGILSKMEHFTIPEEGRDHRKLPRFVSDAEHLKAVLEYHHIPVDDSSEQMISRIFMKRLVTVRYLLEDDS